MDLAVLMDPTSAAIVAGGTLVATLLGSGRRELAAGLGATVHLLKPPFDYEQARAEIARDVERMRTDGVVRARAPHSTDREILTATDALIHDRSLASLVAAHERSRDERVQGLTLALRPVRLAAEMSPMFGMAGTLVALTQVQITAPGPDELLGGIAMAVLTTLYGLLLANLVFHPLARLIARRGEIEDEQRQLLIDWLGRQLSDACPPSLRGTAPRLERVA